MIADQLEKVKAKMAVACKSAGRGIDSVQLVAVSKTKPISFITEAVAAGQTCFGENYVQESLEKIQARPDLNWHYIGSLQTNKAKQVIGQFALIHSVDRMKLARELEFAAESLGVVQPILLQIHIGNEETKHGFTIAEIPLVLEELSLLTHLSLRGLMSLPPLEDNSEKTRANFALLRGCLEEWRGLLPAESRAAFTELSMGTSADYEAAILEGATLVRVGTEIFGERT